MKYHIIWNGEKIASFINFAHRNQVLIFWKERFVYVAEDIIALDDIDSSD